MGRFKGYNTHEVTMLNLDTGDLMVWQTTAQVRYNEGEVTKILYSDRFAEQDEFRADVQVITDVKRYKIKNKSVA